jgi:hypothetical protein
MNENVTVLTSKGTYITLAEWQKLYGLTGDKFGKHFSLGEARFKKDIELFKTLVICAPLIVLLDDLRDATKKPMVINSFNRDKAYQAKLKKQGLRAATYSPHEVKMAADKDTYSFQQSRDEAKLTIELAKKKDILCRVGVEDYIKEGQTFIHIDVCPMYFAPGKPFHAVKHPVAWEVPYKTW